MEKMDPRMTTLAWSAYKAIMKWKFEDEGGQGDEGKDLDDDRRDRDDLVACGCVGDGQ